MKSLRSIASSKLVTESVQNLFDKDVKLKEKYAVQVYTILQKAYRSQGGIKGSGFNDIDDMVKNIPFWKINVVNDIVNVVIMYKFSDDDKKIRKVVALGINTNNYVQSKKQLIDMLKDEFSRSILEISGKMLEFMQSTYPELLEQFRIPASKVSDIIRKDVRRLSIYSNYW